MAANGGVIRSFLNASHGLVAIDGVWTGGRWSPDAALRVRAHRLGGSVTELEVTRVDQPRGRRDALLLVTPDVAGHLKAGDVLSFGESAVTEYAVQSAAHGEIDDLGELPVVAALARHPEQRCILDRTSLGWRAVIFHEAHAELPSFDRQTFVVHRREMELLMRFLLAGRAVATELILNGADVLLGRLVGTVTPLRKFALGTGQEMLLGVAMKERGRFRKEVVEFFEPRVTAKAGSIRLQLHEGRPDQLSLLNVPPAEPFQLFAALVEAVAQRDERRVFEELAWHHVFSVNRFLAQLKDLSLQRVEVRTSDGKALHLGVDDAVWLTVLLKEPVRKVNVTGELFGADFHRNWCRVSPLKGTIDQWTLYFDPSQQSDAVERLMNRRVQVEFETRSPASVRSGSGKLTSIVAARDPAAPRD